ncbi:hypothetical protein B0H13DRAFT_1948259 [Mycena leptocephala]|nr:hypothetical protein B0H13DRAFT_1948259 [Mycena leptocephala]
MTSLLNATRRLSSVAHSLSPRYRYTTMASKPIMLYTVGTPNGRKASVMLEELKAAYGLIRQERAEGPWFIAMNPNGRIPVIVDRARNNFTVFETGAILHYLQQHYDKENRFSFDPATHPNESNEVCTGHFKNAAEQIPYAQKRYNDESKRLLEVLEIRLKDHEYLVGGKYTIADLNAYTWCEFLRVLVEPSLRTEYNVG